MSCLKFFGLIAIGISTTIGTASAQGIPGTFVGATAGPGGNTTMVGGGEFASASGNELGMWLDGSNTTGNGSRSLREPGGATAIPDSGGFRPLVQAGSNIKDAQIVTVISGLSPVVEYEVNVIFSAQWGHENIAIGAGLTPETATQVSGVRQTPDGQYAFGSWLDEVSEQNNAEGGSGTNSAARVWLNSLGTTFPDSNGEIRVYVDHFPPTQFLSPVTSYNGVSVTPVLVVDLICDVNSDGAVNFLDISPFISLLSAGTFQAEADCNLDGVVSFLDIAPFIAILSGQ